MSDRMNRDDLPMLVNTGLRSELSRSESDLPVYTLNEVRSANSDPNIYLIDIPGYQIIAIQLSDRMKKGYMKIDNEVISPSESGLLAAMKTEGRISLAKLYLPNIPFIRVKNESKFDESEPSILNYRGIGSDDIINYLNSQDTEFDYLILDKSNAIQVVKSLVVNKYLKCNLDLGTDFNPEGLVCLTEGCDIINKSESLIILNPGQFYDENNPYSDYSSSWNRVTSGKLSPKEFKINSKNIKLKGAPLFPNNLSINSNLIQLEYDYDAEEVELYSYGDLNLKGNLKINDTPREGYYCIIAKGSVNIELETNELVPYVDDHELQIYSNGDSMSINLKEGDLNYLELYYGSSKFKELNLTLHKSKLYDYDYDEYYDILQFILINWNYRMKFAGDSSSTEFTSWDLNLNIESDDLDYSELIPSLAISSPYDLVPNDEYGLPSNSKITYTGSDPLFAYFGEIQDIPYEQYSILYGLSSCTSMTRSSTVDLSEVTNIGVYEYYANDDYRDAFLSVFDSIIRDRSHVTEYYDDDGDRYGNYEFGFPTKFIPSQDVVRYIQSYGDTRKGRILKELFDNSFYLVSTDTWETYDRYEPSKKAGYIADREFDYIKFNRTDDDGIFQANDVRLSRMNYNLMILASKPRLRISMLDSNSLIVGENHLECGYRDEYLGNKGLESINNGRPKFIKSTLDGQFNLTLNLNNLTLTVTQ